jgi:UrcA family protein
MNFVTVSNLRPRRRGCYGVALALGLSVVAASSGALAQDAAPRSVTVSVRDLDLQTPGGAARLMRRLEHAADTVCGDRFVIDLSQRRQFRSCRQAAVGRAVRDANAPMLSALAQRTVEPSTLAGG